MEKNHAMLFTAVAFAAVLLAFFGCVEAAAPPATEMGGSLVAYSAGPGKGSSFTLEIPIDFELYRKKNNLD